MVQNIERQPHKKLRLRVGYGLQLTLTLVGGACLDLPKHECTHDPRHDTHHYRHINSCIYTAIENTTYTTDANLNTDRWSAFTIILTSSLLSSISQGQLTAAISRQESLFDPKGIILTIDSGASTCSECYYT